MRKRLKMDNGRGITCRPFACISDFPMDAGVDGFTRGIHISDLRLSCCPLSRWLLQKANARGLTLDAESITQFELAFVHFAVVGFVIVAARWRTP